MRIRIIKDTDVEDGVAAMIGSDFLDWLDEKGLELTTKDSFSGQNPLQDMSYSDLAELWVKEVHNSLYD